MQRITARISARRARSPWPRSDPTICGPAAMATRPSAGRGSGRTAPRRRRQPL